MSHTVIPIRASSFATVFDCAHRFEGEQLLGMRKPSSLRAWMGTSIHAGTEAFDMGRMNGTPIRPIDAADVMMELFENPTEEVDLRDEKLPVKEAHRIALTLLSMYCGNISPQFEFTAVEEQLKAMDIDCGGGLIIRLSGKMDRARVVVTLKGRVIVDIKSGSRLFKDGKVSIKARGAQLGTYQILDEGTTGELTSGAQIAALQTTSTPLAGVSRIFDAKRLMLGDERHSGLLDIAARMFRAGLFPPNPSSSLCDKRYCARWDRCAYHE